MMKRQRILALLNPTAPEAEPAFSRAVFLAREMGGALELFAGECKPVTEQGSADGFAVRATMAWLEKIAAPYIKEGLKVSFDVASDRHAYAAMMHKLTTARADIAVKTTCHDSGLSRTLFNYTDWHLIRHCACPLLLAKDECDWRARRIVACVDPAHIHSNAQTLDNQIIETALSLARRLRGELHIFHAMEDQAAFAADRDAMAQRARLLQEFLKPYGCGEQRVHMVAGKPAEALVPFANEISASLVVLGAVPKGILETLFIGNTAERVLDNLSCDILVVKSQPVEVKLPEFVYAPV